MKVKFDADGFRRQMEAYAERKIEQIHRATELACIEIESAAKEKCPKGTDALRQSIMSKVEDSGAKSVGTVGSELEYAPYVHEGTGIYSRTGMGRKDVPWPYIDEKTGEEIWTKGNKPNPFLEDAVNENRDRVTQIYINELKG